MDAFGGHLISRVPSSLPIGAVITFLVGFIPRDFRSNRVSE
jgi:hypothetical protein